MSLSVWLSLFLASWIFSLSPGPGSVLSMTNGYNYGVRHSIYGIFGLILGLWIVFLFVIVGIGAVVNTSTLLFNILKWLGVLYLLYLGFKQIFSKASKITISKKNGDKPKARSLITQGILLNTVNPKVYIFFLAVIPLFITPENPLHLQYPIIALTFGFTDLVIMILYSVFAVKVLGYLKDEKHIVFLNKIFGILFILAAIALSLFRQI